MLTIALAAQKGGVGKTTLAAHLAVQAERSGAGPVALIDADPQASLADWWNDREAETPVFVQTTLLRLRKDIERMREYGIELLIIDTPPAITSTIAEVTALADAVLIPTRPSPHDLRSVARTVELIESQGKPLIFIVNGASPWARITTEAVMALSQHGPLAPVVIHQRADFASSMVDGRTVMEIRRKTQSAVEIGILWNYLANRFLDDVRETDLSPLRQAAYG
jgi:chromosome partitioning protein